MKRTFSILLLAMLAAACNRAASSPPPTQPALNFPTANPASLPQCQPSDLETSSNFSALNGDIIMGVTLINQSKNLCTLSNPPQVSLLEAGKLPMEMHSKALQTEQTPQAPVLVQLQPGNSAIVTVIWHNYCQTPPAGGVALRLSLANDRTIDVKLDLPAAPKCESSQETSTLLVAPYSYPP